MSSTQLHLLTLLIVSTALLPSGAISGDTLTPIQPLADGQTLISANQTFELGFFSPANSTNRYVGIWYHSIPVQTVVWVANRRRPITGRKGNLSITANGTLIVTDGDSAVVWSSAPQALVNPAAQLLNSGNFIVKDLASGSVVVDDPNGFAWQSFDYPTDTILSGQKIGWNLRTGLNRNITSWANSSDPTPGEFTAGMDLHGYPQVTMWQGSRVVYRSGPWNGKKFSGMRYQENLQLFVNEFVYNSDEVFMRFWVAIPNFTYRIWLDETGAPRGLRWIQESGTWNVFSSPQSGPCDALSPCGPNGVCDANTWPLCSCPTGFEPKDPTNWALRDASAGCVRKTALDCANRTDGFATVAGAKLPETSSAWVDLTLNLDQCREQCLKNCSCAAYGSANVSSGIGCIFWGTAAGLVGVRLFTSTGQDLFIRVAAKDLAASSKSSKNKLIIITVCLAIGVAAFVLVFAWFLWRKFRRIQAVSSTEEHYTDQPIDESRELELPLFDFDTISVATDNFSYENQLGQGGFGFVYKGKLRDGQEIAVKRLSKTSIQGVDEFKNEVTLIAKLQHRNLVRLLGCCIARDERLLVYEYMPYKSLDNFLFDKANDIHLNWEARYKIIAGIARGLVYLHQDSRFRIIHRDLKASNILLDKELNPKISDFGLARMFGGDDAKTRTRKVVGTYGYMSPEYAMDGYFSVKSDVFSFGVLVLEIVSGQRNRAVYLSEPQTHLLGNAWNLWNEGRSMELLDASMDGNIYGDEVLRCIKIALLCVQELPNDRPTMSTVVMMLGSDHSALPLPKQPGFIARRGNSEPQSSCEKQEFQSVNDLTITLTIGR